MSDTKAYIVAALQCDYGKALGAPPEQHPLKKDGKNIAYDAKLPGYGRWGFLCPACFVRFGCSLGIGHGQKYERADNSERWICVEGRD